MTMKQKRSNEPNKAPDVADLDDGQLALNTNDGQVFMKKTISGASSVDRHPVVKIPHVLVRGPGQARVRMVQVSRSRQRLASPARNSVSSFPAERMKSGCRWPFAPVHS